MSLIPLTFLNPIALVGLGALPVLYFILKYLPPSAKKIFLPTAHLLKDIPSNAAAKNKAPWWLLLLRLSILACLILFFAKPVLNPQKTIPQNGDLTVIFDNGWSSAQTWNLKVARATQLLEQASKSNRPVRLIFTADKNADYNLISAPDALSRLKTATPKPWENLPVKTDLVTSDVAWISSGIESPTFAKDITALKKNADVTLYLPDMSLRTGLLHGNKSDIQPDPIRIEFPAGAPDRSITIQTFNQKSKKTGSIDTLVSGQPGGNMPENAQEFFKDKTIYQWKVPQIIGTGGNYFKPFSATNNLIGIVQDSSAIKNDFNSAAFYLSHASEPFAKVVRSNIDDLILKNCGIIVLPDFISFSATTLDRLQKWIEAGGILLRFSGPNMAETENLLVPVRLQNGIRSLSGDMTWTKSLKFSAFPEKSPLKNLPVPDITVNRQLLAAPSTELSSRTWATLNDGTPVITAREEGKGLVILVHTTGTPDWSDFVLSGFYVSFLRELVDLTSLRDKNKLEDKEFKPISILDGWGEFIEPTPEVRSLHKADLSSLKVSAEHPPGIYGDGQTKIFFNLGDAIDRVDYIDQSASGIKTINLDFEDIEKNISSFFLFIALALFMLDWLIQLIPARILMISIMVLFLSSNVAKAENIIDLSSSIHIGCVASSQEKLCLKALQEVTNVMKERTSANMGVPVIIHPERDELSFYPLIYWPVETHEDLSEKAQKNLAGYMTQGGILFIDIMDGSLSDTSMPPSATLIKLRNMLQSIEIPPLRPAEKNHVIFKTFYLLNRYPEYNLEGKIWMSAESSPPDELLSPVILTGEDWMHKWAYPNSDTSREMADRFGVNLMMYALTGNYKSDQVHMKSILERMGQ